MRADPKFEEHRNTKGWQEAKERMLDAFARWGGIQRKLFDPVDLPKRRAELAKQARELAAKRPDFEVKIAEPEQSEITDDDLPDIFKVPF
jgi:hypothetical protein